MQNHLNPRPGRPKIKITRETLEQLHIHQGLSVRKIAKRLNVSHGTIQNRLQQAGLPPRSWRLPGEN